MTQRESNQATESTSKAFGGFRMQDSVPGSSECRGNRICQTSKGKSGVGDFMRERKEANRGEWRGPGRAKTRRRDADR